MEQVTLFTKLLFIATTIVTITQFYSASKSTKAKAIIGAIAIVQLILGNTGFYLNATALPPRIMFLVLPAVIIMVILFTTAKGKLFLDGLSLKNLTLLHTIRIPVEIGLYYLFMAKTIPQVMTFEGQNFDILAGITAPIMYYFGFVKNKLSNKVLIAWNIGCMLLLLNIVLTGILSAASPLQQLSVEQPAIALGYWPYNWLPSIIVPLVMLSHVASIRLLLKKH